MSSPAAAPRKKAALRVKELTPALADKECSFKVVVMESNAKDEANTSNNATLLVGDDSGCVSLVLQKALATHLRLGDILQLQQTQVVLKNNRMYLWGGKVERVGEFLLLFKESYNVSTITWVKDPSNPDVMVSNRKARSRLAHNIFRWSPDLRVLVCVDPRSQSSEAPQAASSGRESVTRGVIYYLYH